MLFQVGNVENEYRVFQMDVIAGKPNLETEVKQHTARFKLDYSKAGLILFRQATHRNCMTAEYFQMQYGCMNLAKQCLVLVHRMLKLKSTMAKVNVIVRMCV